MADTVFEHPEVDDGPEGAGRGTAEEQYERNMAIVAEAAAGDSLSLVSKRHGVSVRRCQEIVKAWRESSKTLRHKQPADIVDDLLEGMRVDLEALNEVVRDTKVDTAKVGAINTRRAVRRDITELLQATGTLPNDLGTMKVQLEVQVLIGVVIEVLDEFDIPPEVEERLLDKLGGPTAGLIEAAATDEPAAA